MLRISYFRPTLAVCIISLGLLTGCGDDPNLVPVYPATGTLTMDGEPFGPTTIHLRPMAEEGRMVVGGVDEQGKITFTTFEGGDGAPAGEYRVLIGMRMEAPPSAFPRIYRDAQNSPLTTTISESDENVVKIDMDSKAGPLISAREMNAAARMGAAQNYSQPTEETEE